MVRAMKMPPSAARACDPSWSGRGLRIGGFDAVPVPTGIAKPSFNQLYFVAKKQQVRELWVRGPSRDVKIFPSYRHSRRFVVKHLKRRVGFEFFVVDSDSDAAEVRSLIARNHYVTGQVRGMFLACRFSERIDQQDLRDCNASRLGFSRRKGLGADKSSAWRRPLGGIIAAACVGVLYHGNPLGREQFGARVGDPRCRINLVDEERGFVRAVGDPLSPRQRFLSRWGLAWANRFAIDEPYRHSGLGTVLAQELATAAYGAFLPFASHLEVIRKLWLSSDILASLEYSARKERETPSKNKLLAYLRRTGDFLTEAGYELLRTDPVSHMRRMPFGPGATAKGGNGQTFQLYYHREL